MIDDTTRAYEQLIDRFSQWASVEENIRAAIIIGSRARQDDHPADEWSDLDILIFATDPEPYWTTTDWIKQIGTPWLSFVEPTPDGKGNERRVLFDGGLDVDFIPISVTDLQHMLAESVPSEMADIMSRGIRILIDKDNLAERLQEKKLKPSPYTPPSTAEFLNVVNDFWYHTVWTSKHLRRGELWWAKSCCDNYLKNLLHQMMVWHTHAAKGMEVDTGLRGRFLEEWASPRAVKSLSNIFAHYDEEDIWRALMATMKLFHWLAVETAELLSYPYPSAGEKRVRILVQTLYSGRVS